VSVIDSETGRGVEKTVGHQQNQNKGQGQVRVYNRTKSSSTFLKNVQDREKTCTETGEKRRQQRQSGWDASQHGESIVLFGKKKSTQGVRNKGGVRGKKGGQGKGG